MKWNIVPIGEFGNHQDSWQRLNEAGPRSPLLDAIFLLPAIREFGTGNEVLAVFGGATPNAMAVLRPEGRLGWNTFQPSQAPLGAWLSDGSYDLKHLLGTLVKALPGFPMILGLTQQDPDLLARPVDQGILRTLDYIETARISIQGRFDDYWQARGKNLRHNMKKQRNNLDKLGIATRLDVVVAPEDVPQAIKDYGRLESAGWKAEGGTAIHADNAQGRFYRAMLEAFCGQGKGRIYRYWYNESIVAMDLCIEDHDSLVILKTAYDEQKSNGTSPAFLMRQESFRELFDEGRLKRIEFYGKLMEWHRRWSEEVRTLYHVNCYRWSVIPLFRPVDGR
jgi:CelD/BcsL family acetyltransferase involved in cellulose biosynthesis